MADHIVVRELVKQYPDSKNPALKGMTLSVAEGEFFTLLGPSGCGKTTLLRSVAGLELPDSGVIAIGGRPVYDSASGVNLGPDERNIGMVFQSYAIWPHMTVFENVAFPLRCRKARDIRSRVDEALGVVGLRDFADRYASRLSGGQQQRVALARAIVARPQVMLLDEPLSNLDAALRAQMRTELRRLQKDIGITTVLVTHDQDEALALSDRIAIINAGEILEVATPRELYDRPRTAFTARFIGGANLFAGRPTQDAEGFVVLQTEIGPLRSSAPAAGEAPICFVRPENIHLVRPDANLPNGGNTLTGTVRDVRYAGESSEYDLAIEYDGCTATVRVRARTRDLLSIGASCRVVIAPEDVHVLEAA